jgi:hypothetical protein
MQAYIRLGWLRPAKESIVRTLYSSFVAILFLFASAAAQSKPAGVVEPTGLKSVVPSTFFYSGRVGTVQMRNAVAVRSGADKYVVAALVDTAGYASSVAEKYQGVFITEGKLKIEGSELAPGEYGFGFMGDNFVITDVGANDVLSVASKMDDQMKRPVPLKVTKEGDQYRLYAGKKYVTLQVE